MNLSSRESKWKCQNPDPSPPDVKTAAEVERASIDRLVEISSRASGSFGDKTKGRRNERERGARARTHLVMASDHWRSGSRSTGWSPRSERPRITSSFASTVPSAAHQLTWAAAAAAAVARLDGRGGGLGGSVARLGSAEKAHISSDPPTRRRRATIAVASARVGDGQPRTPTATMHRRLETIPHPSSHSRTGVSRRSRIPRPSPTHRLLGLRGEPLLEEFEEDPLRPAHVVLVRRRELALPVIPGAAAAAAGELRSVTPSAPLENGAPRARRRAGEDDARRDDARETRQNPQRRTRRRARSGGGGETTHEKPSACSWRLKLAMFSFVVSRGCVPVLIACCSAGSPNESQPIGCSTS